LSSFFVICFYICAKAREEVRRTQTPTGGPLFDRRKKTIETSTPHLAQPTMASTTTDTATFYEDEKNLQKLCNFLRSNDGPAVREAIEMDKRVYYLKGMYSKY